MTARRSAGNLSGLEFSRELRRGPYVWPGGYPIYLVMSDGACMCFKCAEEEKVQIRHAAMTKSKNGWAPMSFDVNWEDFQLFCCNCNERIESAYAEDCAEGECGADCSLRDVDGHPARCTHCGHQCPTARPCEKCGSDPMESGDTLCTQCDSAQRAKEAKAP